MALGNVALKGVVITCNYPDDEAEAALPQEMTVDQLCASIRKLIDEEKDMTSFVLAASIHRS